MPGESNELLSLRSAQQNQILDQYRVTMYNQDLRFSLMVKLLEEKGIFVPGEFDNRWPLFLKNDIGAIGPDGIMEGTLKVYFYEK